MAYGRHFDPPSFADRTRDLCDVASRAAKLLDLINSPEVAAMLRQHVELTRAAADDFDNEARDADAEAKLGAEWDRRYEQGVADRLLGNEA